MEKTHIFKESWDVDSRLSSLGLTKQELITVAIKAVTARNDATAIDPINAPGQLSYIYGTRALREALLPKRNWEMDRTDNIEATRNLEENIKIIYQNVDFACKKQLPRAISGKGRASKRLIDNNTGFLWPEMESEFNAQKNSGVWFFCVASNGDEISAELSRPSSIEGNQFGDFLERIFIITDNDWSLTAENDDFSEQDFDIQVTRK